jgi:hypothetical protein
VSTRGWKRSWRSWAFLLAVSGDFTNYFSLVRANGTWAIASKTFFLTGGEAPPAP